MTPGFWRITDLPKVIFDQTFYLQWLARDLFHSYHLLPFLLRPAVWLLRPLAKWISLSEMYILSIWVSGVLSLWLFAWLIRSLGHQSVTEARGKSLLIFFLVQSILGLRPGAPSWYIPFFLLALLCVWKGEQAWESRHAGSALFFWIVAAFSATIYPWYFAIVVGTACLLFTQRFFRARWVPPLLMIGGGCAAVVFFLRARWVPHLLASPTLYHAVIQGIGFGHTTTLSNTILVIFIWLFLWGSVVRRSGRVSHFFLAAWTAQVILWFQSVVTGFSMIPDHFIYTVWILSALSFACWPEMRGVLPLSPRQRRWFECTAWFAIGFVVYIFGKLAWGLYTVDTFPSLIIHTGIWTFLALGLFAFVRPPFARGLAVLIAGSSIVLGVLAIPAIAAPYVAHNLPVRGVRAWISREHPSADLRWCSDYLTGEYLFSTTGQIFHLSTSDRLDPLPLEIAQNRMVELGTYFHASSAGELYIWDDSIVVDLDFACSGFIPYRKLYALLPLSQEQQVFLTGCDEVWADRTRAAVLARIEERWHIPLPDRSPLCDRFVVQKRLSKDWRIPSGYRQLYEDPEAVVYGIR